MVNFENGNIVDEDGFTTTFPSDFSIADKFGVNAIKDTFNRAFGEWKGHYKYLTHLVIALIGMARITPTPNSTTNCGKRRTPTHART